MGTPTHARTHRPAAYRWHRTIGRLAALVGCLLVVGASPAHAACPAGVRADSLATQQLLADMQARGAAGLDDARAVYERARRSCHDIRPARAIAVATNARGLPTPGQRTRTLGVDLVGLRAGAATGWRIDLARTAARVAAARHSAARARADLTLLAAGWGSTARTWSADPTRLAWDPGPQSAVTSILGRSDRARAARLAEAGVRAFGVGSRAAALRRYGLMTQLRIAMRVANGVDDTSSAPAMRVARNVATRTYVGVRAAHQRGWSRVDGSWSTLATHRALVNQSGALLRRFSHSSTSAVVDQLAQALRTAPHVRFDAVPTGEFYPDPREGAFDTQQVSVDVDKPARLLLLVYAADGSLLRGVVANVEPGTHALAWDGTDRTGATVEPGEYRYNVDARDLAGNRMRVPGLQQFTVARDTTPPTVVAASMRIVGAGASARAIVSWDVDEVHSPHVRSWLVLRSGDQSSSIRLHDRIQQATVRRSLDVGPGSWRAVAVFIDGSGNRTTRLLGTFAVR